MRPKVYQGYVLLLLVTTLSKLQIPAIMSAHPTIPIDEAFLELLWPNCVHGALNKAALLKLEAVHCSFSLLFYLASIYIQFCLIWCRRWLSHANFWPFLTLSGLFKVSFPHQIQQNWKVAELKKKKIIEMRDIWTMQPIAAV